MDLFVIAMSRYKRHKYDSTLELCNQMLDSNPNDQVFFFYIFFAKLHNIGSMVIKM